MKKILILILALIIVLGFTACVTECVHTDTNTDGVCDKCDKRTGDCTHEDADTDKKCDKCGAALENGDLVFVKNSRTEFSIVVANSLSDNAYDYVSYFSKNLNNFYLQDRGLVINYDIRAPKDTVEMIIGTPSNRGELFKKDVHYLGYEGFSVEVIGNKLFVIAGGDRGYQKAIQYIEDTLFDLDSFGENVIEELVIPADTKYEEIQTDYDIEELTIDGSDVSDFVIAYTSHSYGSNSAALLLQETIYRRAGAWLPCVDINETSSSGRVIYVEDTTGDAARSTENGSTIYVKGGNLHIECEFEDKFEDVIYSLTDKELSSSRVSLSSNFTFTKDVRNIYYKDFGAVGDGKTDDFFAIKECHDVANAYGHTVNADPDATYYIGKENGTASITIKTDTYWNCCSFIFDDRVLDDPSKSSAYLAPIFKITPDGNPYTLTGIDLPVASLPSGAATIGDWKPGEKVLVTIHDNTKRHYIRYGQNQNNGTDQKEIIIVNPDGTIDPETPVQWDYTTLSKMIVYPIDDTPITVSGGFKDQVDDYASMGTFDNYDHIGRATIYTYFNDAPSEYDYHARNIEITRSNVTVKNIKHVLDDNVATSAPYTGFIKTTYCSDVIVEGMIFQKQKSFSTIGAQGNNVGMGSYEMSANNANRVTWRHCRQSNFFEPDGSTRYTGFMGTNYCKNLKFENMVSCSFDAHCNLYNGTIIDSVCEHLNFIGGGTILYENVTVYTDGGSGAMLFREDYGSTWDGNVIVNGLTLRTSKASTTLSLIGVKYNNHDFGYTCHLPKRIELNDAKIVRYDYSVDEETGIRTEWDVATNHIPLHIYSGVEKYTRADISDPDANMSYYKNDYKKCNCEKVYNGTKTFKDTDGDGRCNNDANPNDTYDVWCWGFKENPNTAININPYIPTEEIYVTNCGSLRIIVPSTPQFEDLKLYVDGVLQ